MTLADSHPVLNDGSQESAGHHIERNAPLRDAGPGGSDFCQLRVAEIFRDRAKALAIPPDEARRSACLDLIAFRLASQRVALEAHYVHAVIGVLHLTPVPGASDDLAGILNFRGVILPVFRLERCLGSDQAERGTHTIVLGELRPEFAFFAHDVEEISQFCLADLRATSQQGTINSPATLGVTDSALNVLDGRWLLSNKAFHIGQQAGRIT